MCPCGLKALKALKNPVEYKQKYAEYFRHFRMLDLLDYLSLGAFPGEWRMEHSVDNPNPANTQDHLLCIDSDFGSAWWHEQCGADRCCAMHCDSHSTQNLWELWELQYIGFSNDNFPMKAYGTAPSFRKEWGLEGTLETGTSPELGWPPCPTPKAAASGDDRLVPGRGWCPCGGVWIHSRDWTCRLFVPGKCLQECDRCLFSSCPLRRPKLRGGRLHCCGEARVLTVSKSIDTL